MNTPIFLCNNSYISNESLNLVKLFIESFYYCSIELSYNKINNYITVDKIIVDENKRKQGYGSNALRFLIKGCKENKLNLGLTASNSFGTSTLFLDRWYRRLGFYKNKGDKKDFRTTNTLIIQFDNKEK